MQARSFVSWSIRLSVIMLLLAGSTWAQFTGNIQGTVADPSGAAVEQGKVTLENIETHISATTTTDDSGGYRLLSLAPGPYKISHYTQSFSTSSTHSHNGRTPRS